MEEKLNKAVELLDLFDRYQNTDGDYLNSPFAADVKEFLFEFGKIQQDERPKLVAGGLVKSIKRQTIAELLEQHKKDRAKVSSDCDLINMSTVERYLRSLG
jgi:hypothetical protein